MIQDNTLLAQELALDLKKNIDGGNLMLKLDMTKAFDRISWAFLNRVFLSFGFSKSFVDMLRRCVLQSSFSI